MILQPFLYPDKDICGIESMYFRKDNRSVSFETYFNAFSIGKWHTYTSLDSLILHIQTKYPIDIECFNAVGSTLTGCNDFADVQTYVDISKYIAVQRTQISVDITKTPDGYTVKFPNLPADGIIYAVLTFPFDISGMDIGTLVGGYYGTDAISVSNTDIALGICTYKREKFLFKNIQSLIDNIFKNNASPLNGHLEIFISDNGNTISPDMIPDNHIHLFSNLNMGGAGGFTRTMLEAVIDNPGTSFTHMLLMDDDIILDTHILERTYIFLSCLKEEYRGHMMGASMFDLDRRYLQMEKGAYSDGYSYKLYHKFFDMRSADFVSANEALIHASYSGWWYCCIPVSFIRPDNLPLPMFLHYDDVEYGSRTGVEPILINGICVWHPPAASKGAASIEYYDIRNSLIMQAACDICTPDRLRTFLQVSFLSVGELFRYRYNVAEARLRGYDDFHHGIDAFIKLNPAALHSELGALNYNFITPDEAGISAKQMQAFICHNKKKPSAGIPAHSSLPGYLLCALCHLLPPVGGTVIRDTNSQWLPFFARRVYVYNISLGKGYIVKRSYRMLFRGIGHYIRTAFHILKDYNNDIMQWKKSIPCLKSADFWKKYLKLK